MICPYCKGKTSDQGFKCVHCGRKINPRAQRPTTGISCPRCHSTTDVVNLGGVHLDLCTHCHGLWFDRDELKQFKEIVQDSELNANIQEVLLELRQMEYGLQKDGYLNCPICHELMRRKNYEQISGIILDQCLKHGTWADHGDAVRLLEIIQDGSLDEIKRKATALGDEEIARRFRRLENKQRDTQARVNKVDGRSRAHFLLDIFGIM